MITSGSLCPLVIGGESKPSISEISKGPSGGEGGGDVVIRLFPSSVAGKY